MIERNEIPADVGYFVAYDPDTGELRWARKWEPRITAGAIAGAMKGRYRHVYIRRKSYAVHRIAWFLMTGEQPPETVDHRDCDTTNNRWSNLRAADNSQSGANRRQQQDTKLKGTHCFRGRWRASIRVKKKPIYLGTFESQAEAHAAYLEAAKKYFGEFARAA